MKFYLIRLKQRPDVFVGKESKTYAINTDAHLETMLKRYKDQGDLAKYGRWYKTKLDIILNNTTPNEPLPYWFSDEKAAAVYNQNVSLKRLLDKCHRQEKPVTYDEYEIVIHDSSSNSSPQIVSATEFYKNWKAFH